MFLVFEEMGRGEQERLGEGREKREVVRGWPCLKQEAANSYLGKMAERTFKNRNS